MNIKICQSRPVPEWCSERRFRLSSLSDDLPIGLLDWLLDKSSLTARLLRASDGHFRVHVMSQQRMRPMFDERGVLGIDDVGVALVRNVQLFCESIPCVFARTVVPVNSMVGPPRRLGSLGNKPLGGTLFADRSMRRKGVEITRLSKNMQLYDDATRDLPGISQGKPDAIWGRRSIFEISNKPLLVSEIFLPGIEQLTIRR